MQILSTSPQLQIWRMLTWAKGVTKQRTGWNLHEKVQGFIQVILALLRCSWMCTASFVFSSKFHTSMLPPSFPMKKTAGLDRDQHPAEYVCSECADRMMGPSWSPGRVKKRTTWWAGFNPGWSVFCYQRKTIGVCYHNFLPPDGKIPLSHCQNNVFKEGRPLHCIHHPVVDSKTVEGLGTCKRGSRSESQHWGYLYFRLFSVLEAEYSIVSIV